MKNIPQKIYLQIGKDADEDANFNSALVTWCIEQIYDNDMEYIKPQQEKEHNKQIQELKAECFCKTLEGMYAVMHHPLRYIELWEIIRTIREQYLMGLKNIK